MERTRKRGKEDYLRVIYELDEDKGVRSTDIARKLKISKASVSEMLRKMAGQNLVTIKPYSRIFLTSRGRKHAEKLFDNHYIIKSFLKKVLRYEEDKAKEESHKLEHAFSHESIRLLERIMESKPLEEPENIIKTIPNYIG